MHAMLGNHYLDISSRDYCMLKALTFGSRNKGVCVGVIGLPFLNGFSLL